MPVVVIGSILLSISVLGLIATFWDLEHSYDPGAEVIDEIAVLPLFLLTLTGLLLIRWKRVLKCSTCGVVINAG
jgi:hypothetical protein